MAQRSSYPHGLSTLPSVALVMGDALFDPNDLLQSRKPGLDLFRAGGFGIDPNQGLGAARAQEHPAAVGQEELEPVVVAHPLDPYPGHLPRSSFGQRFQDPLAIRLVGV